MLLMTHAEITQDPADESKIMFTFNLYDTANQDRVQVVEKYPKNDMPDSATIIEDITDVYTTLQILPY